MPTNDYRDDAVYVIPTSDEMRVACELVRSGAPIETLTPLIPLWVSQFGRFDQYMKRLPMAEGSAVAAEEA